MAIVTGKNELIMRIIKAFGVDPVGLHSFEFRCEFHGLATVKTTRFVKTVDLEPAILEEEFHLSVVPIKK